MVTTLVLLATLRARSRSLCRVRQQSVTLARADSAHTLFTPNAADSGRVGQVYQLPQGGFGVSTGGTSHYQTYVTPGGGGVAVPSGNNTFNAIGSGGRTGVARTPGYPKRTGGAWLPSGHAHVPRNGRFVVAAVDDEVVALGLARNRLADRIVQPVIGDAGAEQRPEVGGILLSQAHI